MFRRVIIIATMLMTVGYTWAAHEVVAPQNIFARECVSLNGSWHYFADPQEQGYYDYWMNPVRWGYFLNAKPQRPSDLIEYDFDASPTMQVPGDWNTQDERLMMYEGTVWFCKQFTIDNGQWIMDNSHRALLYFGAVNYEAIVFVNGKEVGKHIGGFTPFSFDVTDMLHEGENFVVVKVDNKRHRDNVPTRIFDWWNYGGITRDVLLVKVPETYVEDYTVDIKNEKLKIKNETGKYREICFSAKLNKKEAGQQVTLSIPELKIEKTFTTNADGEVSTFNFHLSTFNFKTATVVA